MDLVPVGNNVDAPHVGPVERAEAPPAPALQPGATSLFIAVTYRREYRRCGRSRCTICATGPGHGPSWYASWWQDGHLHTRHIAEGWRVAQADEAE